jgi:hypothetical protein
MLRKKEDVQIVENKSQRVAIVEEVKNEHIVKDKKIESEIA